MSLNRYVNADHFNDLKAADFILAALLHLLVIILVLILNWHQRTIEPQSLKRIEVEMITASELEKMVSPVAKAPHRKPSSAKPAAKKAVPKFNEGKKKAASKTIDDDFDPFAPLESRSRVSSSAKSGPSEIADVIAKQLSDQEIQHYVAMMQQAVQNQWKVPAGVDSTTPDPLVEMVLSPDGRVISARIIESSGNHALDQTLISAIFAAMPFKVPPPAQFEPFRVNLVYFRPLK